MEKANYPSHMNCMMWNSSHSIYMYIPLLYATLDNLIKITKQKHKQNNPQSEGLKMWFKTEGSTLLWLWKWGWQKIVPFHTLFKLTERKYLFTCKLTCLIQETFFLYDFKHKTVSPSASIIQAINGIQLRVYLERGSKMLFVPYHAKARRHQNVNL